MTKNHIHRFRRFNKKNKLWICDDPLCTCVMPKNLIMGKASRCNKCDDVIIKLTWDQLRRAKPLCINCMNTKEAIEFRDRKKILEELGIS